MRNTVWHQMFEKYNFVDLADGSSTVKIVLHEIEPQK